MRGDVAEPLPAVIEFDNLTGDLVAHKSLCTVLTSEHMSGRILGVSKTATVNTRALFLSSGNNVGPVQDMTRRCITIHLDPGCEVPAARSFTRPELVRDVLRERGRYVAAALTIVRAWVVAGRPTTACKSLAGYGDWSDLCRQPLLWLGLADPTESVFEAMAEDPDRETLGRLLMAWQSVFGKTAAMVHDAAKQASAFHDEHVELREVLHDIADERGEINRRRLGWWIKRHAGRIVNGRRFVRASGNRSAARRTRNKRACQPGEIYCVRCRAPKAPAGGMADYQTLTATPGNLVGMCPNCETLMYRRVNLANLGKVGTNLDIAFPQALPRIVESEQASVNSDLG